MKEFLSHAGVPFTARNVETDLEAYRELTRLGFRSVPVTIVGEGSDRLSVTGYDELALKTALHL